MLEQQKQIIQEYEELTTKCAEVFNFMETDRFLEINTATQNLVQLQYHTMQMYLCVVGRLVSEFND